MQRVSTLAALLLVLGMVWTTPAPADEPSLVTLQFEGDISSIWHFSTCPDWESPWSAGDPFVLTYTFDATTPGSGYYQDPVTDIAFQAGALSGSGPAATSSIFIDHDPMSPNGDAYFLNASLDPPIDIGGDESLGEFEIALTGAPYGLWDSKELVENPPDLSNFSIDARFYGATCWTLHMTLTSWVRLGEADTTPPNATADLETIWSHHRAGEFIVSYSCMDDIDPTPEVIAELNGVAVDDAQRAHLRRQRGPMEWFEADGVLYMTARRFELAVTCTDDAGNQAVATAEPNFRRPPRVR